MKRIWVLAALVCLLVSGCKRIYPNEYIHVAEHNAPYAYKDDSSQEQVPRTPTVSDYYALRSVLSGFVASGVEHGLVQMVSYRGDEEQDLKRVTAYLTEEDPICAYAIDYITLERTQTEEGSLVSVDAVYRRSVGEIESIQFVRGNDAALGIMRNAMTQFHSSATIRISGYTEEDFVRSMTDYCMQHPDLMPVIPEISAAVYPDTGNVRVVEMRFRYPEDSQAMKNMRSEAAAVLSSAYSYIRYAEEEEQLRLMAGYFSSRFPAQEDPEASFYSLLCQGVGNSAAYASVVYYLSVKAGLDCRIVSGSREGEPYYWNIISLEGSFYHFDFFEAARKGQAPEKMTDSQMTDYDWDREAYPACTGAKEQTD